MVMPMAGFRGLNWLWARIPIETVSILLGHSSVKITEKLYSPWVKAGRTGSRRWCGERGRRELDLLWQSFVETANCSERRNPLTRNERLILANQYTILEKLHPADAAVYAWQREIVEMGYVTHYDELNMSMDEEMPEAASRHVLDVLSLYRDLTFSNKELPADKKFKDEEITFPGFDGNEESQALAYAQFYVNHENRFQELTDNGKREIPNSHWATRETYERMLAVHRKIRATKTNVARHENLTREEIEQVLEARQR
jgi:uncharacterized protein YfbU (UPF0304 family)